MVSEKDYDRTRALAVELVATHSLTVTGEQLLQEGARIVNNVLQAPGNRGKYFPGALRWSFVAILLFREEAESWLAQNEIFQRLTAGDLFEVSADICEEVEYSFWAHQI